MSRTPAKFRQADIMRAVRAAPEGYLVRLEPTGDIVIEKDFRFENVGLKGASISLEKPIDARPEYKF